MDFEIIKIQFYFLLFSFMIFNLFWSSIVVRDSSPPLLLLLPLFCFPFLICSLRYAPLEPVQYIFFIFCLQNMHTYWDCLMFILSIAQHFRLCMQSRKNIHSQKNSDFVLCHEWKKWNDKFVNEQTF